MHHLSIEPCVIGAELKACDDPVMIRVIPNNSTACKWAVETIVPAELLELDVRAESGRLRSEEIQDVEVVMRVEVSIYPTKLLK